MQGVQGTEDLLAHPSRDLGGATPPLGFSFTRFLKGGHIMRRFVYFVLFGAFVLCTMGAAGVFEEEPYFHVHKAWMGGQDPARVSVLHEGTTLAQDWNCVKERTTYVGRVCDDCPSGCLGHIGHLGECEPRACHRKGWYWCFRAHEGGGTACQSCQEWISLAESHEK